MTSSQEEYLKTIYILIKNKKEARVTDIANYLSYSKASVNKALKVLKNMNFIQYETYGDIFLTKEGEETAKTILRKHNALKEFLIQILEVDSKIAEIEAKSMKYSVSEETISKFEKYIKSIIDVNELKCDYDPKSEKCRNCVNKKTKDKFDYNK